MNQEKLQPDCIIEQSGSFKDFRLYYEDFKPLHDTVAITRVYLREWYKKELQNDFHYSY